MYREIPQQNVRSRRALSLIFAGLWQLGCGEQTPAPEGASPSADAAVAQDTGTGEDVGNPASDVGEGEPDAPSPLVSLAPRLKARSGKVMSADLAQALDLPREAVCRELGLYDCAETVHRIALGGVEPYELAIRAPLPVAPVTAPIAMDRLALHACGERARRDFEEKGEGVFAPLLEATPPSRATLEAVAAALVERILRREATAEEISEIANLYGELEAANESESLARDWAVSACFALATHVEAIFY